MPESTYQLKITLRQVRPPVWRRVVVPGSMTLAALHEVVQTAMGWSGYHLHQFEVDGRRYAAPSDFDFDFGFGEPARDEAKTRLQRVAPEPGAKIRYEYDFGDGWEHDILVESIERTGRPEMPRCLAGRRACPPEDCGGPYGYANLLEALVDPEHPDHAELTEWVGGPFDPAAFDRDETSAALGALYEGKTHGR